MYHVSRSRRVMGFHFKLTGFKMIRLIGNINSTSLEKAKSDEESGQNCGRSALTKAEVPPSFFCNGRSHLKPTSHLTDVRADQSQLGSALPGGSSLRLICNPPKRPRRRRENVAGCAEDRSRISVAVKGGTERAASRWVTQAAALWRAARTAVVSVQPVPPRPSEVQATSSPTEPSSRWSCRQPWWASQSPWRRPRPFLKLDFGTLRIVVFECLLVRGKISDMLIMNAHKMDNVATFLLGEFALYTKLFHKHRWWSPSGDREDETALSRAHVSGSHVNTSTERKRRRGTCRICLLLYWTLLNCDTLMIGQNDANRITWQFKKKSKEFFFIYIYENGRGAQLIFTGMAVTFLVPS